MQTFLPYPSFTQSVQCLDSKRLGKQRVEAKQILNALERRERIRQGHTDVSKAWINHPAVLMWEGYETTLALYHDFCIAEWAKRGYNNTMTFMFLENDQYPTNTPKWLGDKAFHDSHKSNLLRKDATYYSQFDWNVSNDLTYVWPVGEAVKL